jgi:hypothetical protein
MVVDGTYGGGFGLTLPTGPHGEQASISLGLKTQNSPTNNDNSNGSYLAIYSRGTGTGFMNFSSAPNSVTGADSYLALRAQNNDIVWDALKLAAFNNGKPMFRVGDLQSAAGTSRVFGTFFVTGFGGLVSAPTAEFRTEKAATVDNFLFVVKNGSAVESTVAIGKDGEFILPNRAAVPATPSVSGGMALFWDNAANALKIKRQSDGLTATLTASAFA